jgi:S1-C subfamily serine protease
MFFCAPSGNSCGDCRRRPSGSPECFGLGGPGARCCRPETTGGNQIGLFDQLRERQHRGHGIPTQHGLIVTNQHVVGTCEPDELQVISSASQRVTLTRAIIDKDRDLALLRPSRNILGGLELSAAKKPLPGTVVSTWGYQFLYNGYYPLLSVGYVAGYREVQLSNRRKVKHVIVNGAFNHGNSGGRFL